MSGITEHDWTDRRSTTMNTETLPHSRCKTCGIDLLTLDDARAHMNETLDASPHLRSHTTEVINQTEPERRASRARNLVQDAIYDAIERIADDRGDLTGQEIREALSWIDLDDEWSDWCER